MVFRKLCNMKRVLDDFRSPFDVLILGGGITGAGIALDAVLRGMQVGLIDKGDFASGTSSVSSKLVHGGLRYLEHGQLRLVSEALHERSLLLRNAPHLVHPLRFIIPFYDQSRVHGWKWRAGLLLYDLLAGSANICRSRPLDRRDLLRELPHLRRQGLRNGAAYFDAQMDDARLCLEVVQTAAHLGAHVTNYVEAVGFEQSRGKLAAVHVQDHIGGERWTIRARQVVNATGPWVDSICRLVGDDSGPHLQPTKGVHLLAGGCGLTSALLLLHPRDGRVFFVMPWRRPDATHAKTLIGTTDTLCDESADALTVTEEDVGYLLEGYNHYLSPPLTDGDILSKFVGLRPLLRAAGFTPAGQPSAMSREFRWFVSPSGLLSVAGGKYTTYRHMAEVVTDAVAARLGCRRRCRTRNWPLDGAPAEPWNEFRFKTVTALSQSHGLSHAAAAHLVHRYGGRAEDVAHYLERRPDLATPVMTSEPDLQVEFLYQREEEMAIRPGDFLLRRTHLGLIQPQLLANPVV